MKIAPFVFAAVLSLCPGVSRAQDKAGQPAQAAPELSSHDQPAVFKTRVNLVLVPVVVRDRQGHAVGNLKQEDFRLFDKGKSQEISKFSVEQWGGRRAQERPRELKLEENPTAPERPPAVPERFIAYLFDDVHLGFGDLVGVRDAADRHMASLGLTDRAAILTTSGQTTLDFTDDRAKLHDTLWQLRPRPVARPAVVECPDLGYYIADRIQNHNDSVALNAAIQDVLVCNMGTASTGNASVAAAETQMAESVARMAATRAVTAGEHESRISLGVLRDAVRRLSTMPGQRTIVLVSPGFIAPEMQAEKNDVMDRAIRSSIVISSIDARGLYVPMGYDASQRTYNPDSTRVKIDYAREEARQQADVLAEMAAGTGGTFFENSNDLDAGFRKAALAPEFYYILGFSPQNLKLDGSFHALKVAVKGYDGSTLSARRGYYAPRHPADAAETAREEIQEAIFSREEIAELPVDLHTQFFKSTENTATLTVVARLDPKRMQFRKEEGRNRNTLTVVSGLFDRNGNFISGIQKVIELRLRDESLQKLSGLGLTVKTNYEVKPGSYVIRLVVRDTEGQLMSAENGAVEIP